MGASMGAVGEAGADEFVVGKGRIRCKGWRPVPTALNSTV